MTSTLRVLFALTLCLHGVVVVVLSENEVCTRETCPETFSYPQDLDWDASDLGEVWSWLKNQMKKEAITFCRDLKSEETIENDNRRSFLTVSKVPVCSETEPDLLNTNFKGKFGKTGLPEKQGQLESIDTLSQSNGQCIKMARGVQAVSGQFTLGLPQGRCTVMYSSGESAEAHFKDGFVEGKVRQFSQEGRLLYVGLFSRGLPHGPVWIFPYSFEEDGAVLVHYNRGELDSNFDILHLDKNSARLGKLVNSTFLEKSVQVTLQKSATFNCVTVPQIPRSSSGGSSLFRLPVRIPHHVENDGRLYVRTSKTLFFNRIAKTGSQAFIALLYRLEKVNNFKVRLEMLQKEFLLEPPEVVSEVVHKVLKISQPSVWIRHYNFVDFELYGSPAGGSPDWFNVVRDPIERVVSWFYYWRSAWNIVERKLQYPDEPLPDPQYLRKDFDTCVLDNDPECQFIQYSNVLDYGDHRSQMMAFCGHDLACAAFNSEEVLQRAKANVDKFYPVVGVLENLNQSLAVMEHKLPHIFKGATKLYAEAKEVKKFRNRNAFKVPVSDDVMKMVRANFTREIEFYEFCKQRLEKQYLDLNLKSLN